MMTEWEDDPGAIRLWTILAGPYLDGRPIMDGMRAFLTDFYALCRAHDLDVEELTAELVEWAAIGGGPADDDRYTGWDRIHDDNKAEGRPIGNQWDSDGVDYSAGYKVRRPRNR